MNHNSSLVDHRKVGHCVSISALAQAISAPKRHGRRAAEIPGTKSQNPKGFQAPSNFDDLNFGICLELGVWDLDLPLCGGIATARYLIVETARHSLRKVAADPDIFFHCQHCKAALVVNRSAAGMMLTCQKCGQLTTVPKSEEPNVDALAYAEEIRGKLTENESQRAEITGNINQLTIQLHRWQLRLQTLNDRKAQLEKELGQR